MSDYNSYALIALQGELRTKVVMSPHLTDMLDTAAGGFMTRAEALSVRSAASQMEQLIEILSGKEDKHFDFFCNMLRKSNHCAWADALKWKAKSLRANFRGKGKKNDLHSRISVQMV